MWANTGDVDPVLARMLHMLRHNWASNPDDGPLFLELGAVVAGTRVDAVLSQRRALYVIDRGIRQDLPLLLRAAPREGVSSNFVAAECLEQLRPLEDARSAGLALSLTFDLESRVLENRVEQRMMRVAWEATRHAELALFADRIYQLGSAAVNVCEMFVLYRGDLAELGCSWAPARDLARRLAFARIREAALQR